MKDHHRITKKENSLDNTLNLGNSLNVKVISENGFIVGKASQIRIHPTKMCIEGILVSRGIFKKPLYIGVSYIKRLSHESFILKINPSTLLKGKNVVDTNGKILGKVKKIVRKEHANDIKELVVKSLLRKEIIIAISNIKSIGENILLNSNYHAKQKHIWKKS
ncbi:PRC-barrel domain-containing protein [Candidatus Pacearchaeota archaeon]|nr:PRC-barrel domain-containing protein [Candidatus Pacearchaeota archaeon]